MSRWRPWSTAEIRRLQQLRRLRFTAGEIGIALGRSRDSVAWQIKANPLPSAAIGADAFAELCQEIVATKRGHEAHRALDLLTNDVLRALGYGDGIAIFEAAVGRWHEQAHGYPYSGPCPNCEAI